MMRRGACITFYLHTPQVRQPLRTYRHALALSSINAPPPRATKPPLATKPPHSEQTSTLPSRL